MFTHKQVAELLANTLGIETVAGVLNDWLIVSDHELLTDAEVRDAEKVFDHLTVLRPDACNVAQGENADEVIEREIAESKKDSADLFWTGR